MDVAQPQYTRAGARSEAAVGLVRHRAGEKASANDSFGLFVADTE
jgi:hypothetical protein